MTNKISLEKNYIKSNNYYLANQYKLKILFICLCFLFIQTLPGFCDFNKNNSIINTNEQNKINNDDLKNEANKGDIDKIKINTTSPKDSNNKIADGDNIEKDLENKTVDVKSGVQEKKLNKESPSVEVPKKSVEETREKKDSLTEVKKETEVKEKKRVKGELFVLSVIKPIDYELNERFWGWRPNDILNFTDNINNMQKGILEVTRRSVIVLANNISRTGSNDSYDENVENAMNWFMVRADKYWFPSPESKYNEGIYELNEYIRRLNRKTATFYSRTDNLIPLLKVFEDLLGSCDQNLLKTKEDCITIKHGRIDDIFYYARGTACAMHSILQGTRDDFKVTLDAIQGSGELLDNAIEYLGIAKTIEPWLVTDGSLDSIFANHRANMSQPLNQSRYYLGILVRTLQGY